MRTGISFRERDSVVIGILGTVAAVVVLAVALNASVFMSLATRRGLSAEFAEAGGLGAGDDVRIAGLKVGSVKGIDLDGSKVLVRFEVGRSVELGTASTAAIKTHTVLGRKYLALTPAGRGNLSGDDTIPLARTQAAYDLTDTLANLTTTSAALDTAGLADELKQLSLTFRSTPEEFAQALAGVSGLSDTIARRDAELKDLFRRAKAISGVLAERREQVRKLIVDGDAVVREILAQRQAVDQLFANVSDLVTQVQQLVRDGRTRLRPALVELQQVLAIVNRNRARVQQALATVGPFARSLGEAVGSGPLFLAHIGNLTPPGWVTSGGSR